MIEMGQATRARSCTQMHVIFSNALSYLPCWMLVLDNEAEQGSGSLRAFKIMHTGAYFRKAARSRRV